MRSCESSGQNEEGHVGKRWTVFKCTTELILQSAHHYMYREGTCERLCGQLGASWLVPLNCQKGNVALARSISRFLQLPSLYRNLDHAP